MKFLGPALGGLEAAGGTALTIAGAPQIGVPLALSGVGQLGTGIAGAVQKPPSIPSLSPTLPTQSQTDLSSLLGSGIGAGGGLSGSFTPSVGGGGGGSTFGDLGGGDLQGLLSKILQGISGGTF